jgi:hypothetical protein
MKTCYVEVASSGIMVAPILESGPTGGLLQKQKGDKHKHSTDA